MRRIKCVVEYDGSNYSGWQKQANTACTIQEKIEEGLKKITGSEIKTFVAGRTDAGVHALGQVFHFDTNSTIPVERFPFALNSVLPDDIVIKKAEETGNDFHARFSARGKIYRYQIYNSPWPRAIGRNYYYHFPFTLDVEKMREGARYLTGKHDFSAFRASGCGAKSTVKELYSIKIEEQGPELYLTFYGSGFLYNMVRIIVGTFLHVGRGKILPCQLKEILASRNRENAGPTAPPEGLFLVEIKY